MPTDWTPTTINGRSASVFDPSPRTPFALLFLHDHDGTSPADDPTFTAVLRRHRLPCVVPHGGQCWWVDRVSPAFDPVLSPERHLLDQVGPWLAERWALGPRGIGVAGIGMGGQGAVRLALRHPDRFPVAASLSGAFDFHDWHGRGTPLDEMYETREKARQDTAVLQLDPFRWPPHIWFACDPTDERHRGNDRLHEKLSAYGVPHAADLDTSGPDYLARMIPAMLAFVASGLERESRRLM